MDKEKIKQRVAKALDSQFEIYTWEDMLADCELPQEEFIWAKKHLGYKLVEIE